MKSKYGEKLEVKIHTMDSAEAGKYRFKGKTNVLFEGKPVPLKIAMDKNKMGAYLSAKL